MKLRFALFGVLLPLFSLCPWALELDYSVSLHYAYGPFRYSYISQAVDVGEDYLTESYFQVEWENSLSLRLNECLAVTCSLPVLRTRFAPDAADPLYREVQDETGIGDMEIACLVQTPAQQYWDYGHFTAWKIGATLPTDRRSDFFAAKEARLFVTCDYYRDMSPLSLRVVASHYLYIRSHYFYASYQLETGWCLDETTDWHIGANVHVLTSRYLSVALSTSLNLAQGVYASFEVGYSLTEHTPLFSLYIGI